MVITCLVLWKLPNFFWENFMFLPAMYNDLEPLHPYQFLALSLYYCSHSNRCVVTSHCGFNFHSLMANDVAHIIMCLFSNGIPSSVKCLFISFLTELLEFFLLLNFEGSFYIIDTSPLLHMLFVNNLSHYGWSVASS